MPVVPSGIVAIVCSDIHLSSKPPIARSTEPDWLKAQARQLHELRDLAEEHKSPVVVAGDVFDRWNASAELINFAFRHLPNCYAVPGQHDLAYHAYADIRKTAYWSLVEGDKIINIPPHQPIEVSSHGLRLHGFPWGTEPRPLANPHDLFQEIAIVHHYVWDDEHGHPGASPDDHVRVLRKKLRGHGVAVFGDNHVPFEHATNKEDRLFNCGGFYRRRADEVSHRPSVGLLSRDGVITRHYLDVSKDVFASPETIINQIGEATGADLEGFVAEISRLQDAQLDFASCLRRYMKKKKIPNDVRMLVLRALNG